MLLASKLAPWHDGTCSYPFTFVIHGNVCLPRFFYLFRNHIQIPLLLALIIYSLSLFFSFVVLLIMLGGGERGLELFIIILPLIIHS